MEHMRLNLKMRFAAALLSLLVAVGGFSVSAVTAQNHATAASRIIAIHGNWTGRAPGPSSPPEIEVGQNTDAGLLNGTFVVNSELFEGLSTNGSFIVHHQDTITSATHRHVDAGGATVFDTIEDDLTITVISDDGRFRFVFIGKLYGGTGIFAGADGYYTGEGTSVATPRGGDPTVSYFAGTIGGELRLS
jgi:hypothetical protein